MSNKYIEYLKDNPQGYWFKRKLYGWGWVPVRWQGWTVIAVPIIYIMWMAKNFALRAESGLMSENEPWIFLIKIIISMVVIIGFCYWKGESPRWQWGIPKD